MGLKLFTVGYKFDFCQIWEFEAGVDITKHREPKKRCCHEGATSFTCGCTLTLCKCVQFSHAGTQYSLVESTKDKAVVCRTLAAQDDTTIFCSSCFLVLCFFI